MFRKFLFVALVLIHQSPFVGAAESSGRIEMPLTDWQQTLERLRLAEDALQKSGVAKKQPSPVPGIVHSTYCEVTTDGELGHLTVEYDVESLTEGWSIILLTDDTLPLEAAESTGGRVIHQDGQYSLLADAPLRAKVKLTFSFPGTQSSFQLPDTLSARLGLISANPKTRLEAGALVVAAGKQITLPTRERTISLRVLSETEAGPEKVVVTAPTVPGKWQSHAETMVRYEDGRLNCSSRIVLWCAEGDERLAMLELPPQTMLISVASEDLLRWNIEGKDQLRLEWKTAGTRQRVIEVRYGLEQKNLLSPWHLVSLRSTDDGEKNDVWSVGALPGLHFTEPPERPMTATLSGWMRDAVELHHDPVFAAPSGFDLAVDAVKTLILPDASITSAKYLTRLSRGGGVLTEAQVEVGHAGAVGAEFQLPKDARLVSCKIRGAAQSPVDLGEGHFRLDLPASGGASTLVDLSFAQQGAPLPPANGKIHLALLTSPLMSDHLEWTVELPDDLALNTFEGSVTAVGGGSGLRFRQELSRETAPWVDLFYQKKLK